MGGVTGQGFERRYSVYLLYWYKRANTDAEGAAAAINGGIHAGDVLVAIDGALLTDEPLERVCAAMMGAPGAYADVC